MKKVLAVIFCLIFIFIFFAVSFHTHHQEVESTDCSICISARILNTIDFTSHGITLFICFTCVFLLFVLCHKIPKPISIKLSSRDPPQI